MSTTCLFNGISSCEKAPPVLEKGLSIKSFTENLGSLAEKCLELSTKSGWESKYNLEKWQWLLRTCSSLTVVSNDEEVWVCCILRKDYEPVSFIGPQMYSYVGMLLVDPSFRGKHIAQHLISHQRSTAESVVGAVTTSLGLQPYLGVGVTPVEPFLNSLRRVEASGAVAAKLEGAHCKPTLSTICEHLSEIIALDASVTGLNRASVLTAAAEREHSFTCVLHGQNGRIVAGLMGFKDNQTNELVLGPIIGTDETCLALIGQVGNEQGDEHLSFAVKGRPHILQTLQETGFKICSQANHGECYLGAGMPPRSMQWYFAPLNFFHG